MSSFLLRNNTGADVTNSELDKLWSRARGRLFELGEARGEEDIPPRDMPATTALKNWGGYRILLSKNYYLGMTSTSNMASAKKKRR